MAGYVILRPLNRTLGSGSMTFSIPRSHIIGFLSRGYLKVLVCQDVVTAEMVVLARQNCSSVSMRTMLVQCEPLFIPRRTQACLDRYGPAEGERRASPGPYSRRGYARTGLAEFPS
ncbi:hypothetical protein TNCV_2236631 [Trichonephila clavipes]|nr:hypothetical protein TNCV_2236631 [Trichonephila clavipes]